MRTNEERAALVRGRVSEIKKNRQRKRTAAKMTFTGIGAFAACLCILVGIGRIMPDIAGRFQETALAHPWGTASLLAESDALGYTIMAIFAFLLGICVTTLLYVIHRRTQRQKKESERDE